MVSLRFRYALPAELEDDFVAELWARGTRGVEVAGDAAAAAGAGGLELIAYFPPQAGAGVGEPGAVWAARGVALRERGEEPDRDWLAVWRAAARPFTVGRRFRLDPRDPDDPAAGATGGDDEGEPAADRITLRLPARAAFGTGSHESTRLALELLEEVCEETPAAGRRVLDVGTGTGVLALAALALGAASAVAYDADVAAPFHARVNRRLNRRVCRAAGGGRLRLFAGTTAALRDASGAGFDLLLVNVLPERIRPELPRLAARLAAGGELIYSGLLAECGGEATGWFAALGLAERGRRTAGEWLALRLARVAA